MDRPEPRSQAERSWLNQHAGHPIEFVKHWDSVIALKGGPGDLWKCDCKGDGDRIWFAL